jgi:hypothetical protein
MRKAGKPQAAMIPYTVSTTAAPRPEHRSNGFPNRGFFDLQRSSIGTTKVPRAHAQISPL